MKTLLTENNNTTIKITTIQQLNCTTDTETVNYTYPFHTDLFVVKWPN